MILSAFSTRRVEESVRYRVFVAEGKHQPAPWERLKGRIYLGSDAFIQKMQRKMYAWVDFSEVPSAEAPTAEAFGLTCAQVL